MSKTRIYYSVEHSENSFSPIKVDKANNLLTNLEAAKEMLEDFCSSEHAEYRAYWEAQRPFMEIFRVVEVKDKVEIKPTEIKKIARNIVEYMIDNDYITEFETEQKVDYHLQDIIEGEIKTLL
jgi:hypothetical protein